MRVGGINKTTRTRGRCTRPGRQSRHCSSDWEGEGGLLQSGGAVKARWSDGDEKGPFLRSTAIGRGWDGYGEGRGRVRGSGLGAFLVRLEAGAGLCILPPEEGAPCMQQPVGPATSRYTATGDTMKQLGLSREWSPARFQTDTLACYVDRCLQRMLLSNYLLLLLLLSSCLCGAWLGFVLFTLATINNNHLICLHLIHGTGIPQAESLNHTVALRAP
ncbi:uncharacterized protein K460DRAFT_206345 [Cucurbitaria berberidis CBS 394.84]|uniref:Uncharacterized protein n=1 Tax=Cucurbitaria berberidis CBS 394.84 TaxID=1168544 RepID=A0A9P4G768_9PLEO|nr:uncharacterized protein K460DRAFT_206345 [Cucurbitaria berberidis CBS 394.84]KAF1840301.1 hypothetical protein K460DRAFT_206345 [Cucurbitaria berberidis CBS 394.84]